MSANGLTPEVRRIAVVVILGSIMTFLDATIVNVALRPLAVTFHEPLDKIQWVVTSYLLALAAVIPVTGWAARRLGARRLYLVTVALFTIGSVLCGLARSADELIVFRALQGLGGGMVLPVGQIILARTAGPRNMTRVMSFIGIPTVLAPIIGPTLGGLMLETVGWRWIFFVNAPVGVAAMIAGWRLIPRGRAEDAGPLDVLGLVTVAAGVVGLTYGLADIGTSGHVGSVSVLAPIAGGVVLLAAFVTRSWRIPRPLLDVRLYRNGAFSAASLATFCMGAALYGGMILMPIYFQVVRHQSEIDTGLLLMPQGLGAACAMRPAGRLSERIGGGRTGVIGCLVTIAGTMPLVLVHADTSYVLLGAAMFVRGMGIGMSAMPAMTAAYKVLMPVQVNDATPQLNVLQRVGGSVGTAILTVVLQNRLDRAGADGAGQARSFGVTFCWVLAITAAAMLSTIVLAIIERRSESAARAGAGWDDAAAAGSVTDGTLVRGGAVVRGGAIASGGTVVGGDAIVGGGASDRAIMDTDAPAVPAARRVPSRPARPAILAEPAAVADREGTS
jgi:EmrB/QacA subfamily drug resistance transporter